MMTDCEMNGRSLSGVMVCTPVEMEKSIVLVAGVSALESMIACRRVPVPAPTAGSTPPLSPVLVTVKMVSNRRASSGSMAARSRILVSVEVCLCRRRE